MIASKIIEGDVMALDPTAPLVFADESIPVTRRVLKRPWKILIADDEPDVHVVTALALRGFSFRERGIEFLHAYSGREACEVMEQNPDIAVVLLDVVMETPDAGLNTVRWIREEQDNQLVRIILRTGLPGHAPEQEVVLNYHINDYKTKTELTSAKLFTSVVVALRSYQDLQTIEASRRSLLAIADASRDMNAGARQLFIAGLMMHLCAQLDVDVDDLILVRRGAEGGDTILAACGAYQTFIGDAIATVSGLKDIAPFVTRTFADKAPCAAPRGAIHLFPLPHQIDVAVWVGDGRAFSESECLLIEIFCVKILMAHEHCEAAQINQLLMHL